MHNFATGKTIEMAYLKLLETLVTLTTNSGLVVVDDHNWRRFPERYGQLGFAEAQL
jgi:predicted N-formylglutamate amidohydrolase